MSARHPLQRLASPSRSLSYALHLAGICSFLASFVYLSLFPVMPEGTVGGSFMFLTNIGLVLSFITFAIGYGADIILLPQAFDLKNTLSVCATPLEVLIAILYWSLRTYDRNLVFPPELDIDLPLLPDIGFHAAPAIFLTLDLLLFSPPWTITAQEALGLSLCLASVYWGWIEVCYSFNEFYPYPIFELLNTPQRALLFIFSAFLMAGSTMVLKNVYHRINGVEVEPEKED